MKKVLIVGSAEQSGGGVATVIRLMKKMPFWKKYRCYWLGTQIQRNYAWKLWYAVKGNVSGVVRMPRYDIVHFHTVPDLNCMIIQLPLFLWARILGKRTVMHVHVGNQLEEHQNDRFFIWWLRHTDHIVLLAEKWRNLFEECYVKRNPDIPFPKRKVIYNACESVERVDMSGKEKVIVMAAYFCENKAPDVLLKAWKMICRDYPDWRVVMMGNGEVERYRAMAVEMGVADSVVFTGYIRGVERETLLRKAAIYCMCSYREGFPMVVLEAWMYGICVVTTPVGGLPDVIEEGRNCLTFGFGNHEVLASQLRRLMDKPERREEMAVYSRRFVEKRFGTEEINERFEELYDSLYS